MVPGAQEQMTRLVSDDVAENHSLRYAAAVSELLGIVREDVGHCTEAPTFGKEGETKAAFDLAQAIGHGLR